jgi:3-isopropylmalate/(R)-2-methylmalate dehydratase small subunit
MRPFTTLSSKAVPMRRANVDTDQLIPARFLRKPRGDGYHPYLFHDMRRDADGEINGDFILDHATHAEAEIIVADRNFGCGSSREGAVYALGDAGYRCVIAPSFGDIFYNNSTKNGLLPIVLDRESIETIWEILEADASAPLSIDLQSCEITLPNGPSIPFEIDPFKRESMLSGTDDIDLTLDSLDDIERHEQSVQMERPWLTPSPAHAKE